MFPGVTGKMDEYLLTILSVTSSKERQRQDRHTNHKEILMVSETGLDKIAVCIMQIMNLYWYM